MASAQIEKLITPPLAKKHVAAMLRYYGDMVRDFKTGEWEDSLGKAGKFVEAVLKALYVHVGKPPPQGKAFKADHIINELGQQPAGSHHDSIRLTIPRACRFVYEIASNRGGRHDPDEVDPNEMDATSAISVCSWVLGELIRIAQKGAMDLKQAKRLVDSLTEKKYPLVEEVDGRAYFHLKKKSAPDVAFLALARRYPRRIARQDLIATLRRNGFSEGNARVAVQRIAGYVDNDGNDNLRLLAPGLRRAEELMRRESV